MPQDMILRSLRSLGYCSHIEHAGVGARRERREANQVQLQVEVVGTAGVLVAAADGDGVQPETSSGGSEGTDSILSDRREGDGQTRRHPPQDPAGGDLGG